MASEVTSNKSQAARPIMSDSVSVKTPEKGPSVSQGSKTGQDFLAALDKATEQKIEKPKTSQKSKSDDTPRNPTRSDDKQSARSDRDLSRVKPPKLKAARENKVESRDGSKTTAAGEIPAQDDGKQDDKALEPKGTKDPSSVKDVMRAHRDSIENSPVVAFLTGHLEKLEPAQIPTIVAGNDFVQTALSEADIEQFMQQPMKVSELFESLGLPKYLMSQASAAGLDLDQVITPQSFFKDLGIDPQRVAVELQLLRDNLGLGGVSMYMGRAQSLRSPEELGRGGAQVVPGGARAVDPQGQMHQGKVSPTLAGIEDIKTPSMGRMGGVQQKSASLRLSSDQGMERPGLAFWQDDTVDEVSLEQGPQSLAYVLAAQDWLRSMASTGRGSAAADDSGLMNLEGRLVRSEMSPMIRPDVGLTNGQELSLAGNMLPQEVSQGVPLEGKLSGPTANGATFDAWRTLGDTLRGVDTETLVVEGDSQDPQMVRPTMGSMAELALATGPKNNRDLNPDVVLRAPWLVAQESLQKGMSGEPSDVLVAEGSVWGFNSAASSNQTSMTGSVGAKPPMAIDLKNRLSDSSVPLFDRGGDILGATIQAGLETSNRDSGEQSFGSGQESDRGSDNGSARSAAMDALSVKGPGFEKSSFDQLGQTMTDGLAPKSAESPMTPAQRAHLVQQVIDRTAMLSGQGGGTVRLDLSSADLGRMELAVAMDEGRVNLRVLTGSDGMRSAILTDMTRLKEALGLQNIQLGQVEVGVAGQQTPSGGQGFAGQGSFDQRRDFSREDFSRTMAQAIGSRSGNRAPAVEIAPKSALTPAETLIGNGRISLRI